MIKVHGVKQSFSGTISFENLSSESYWKLLDFIQNIQGPDDSEEAVPEEEQAVKDESEEDETIPPRSSSQRYNWDGRFIQVGDSLLLSKKFQSVDRNAQMLYLCMCMESGGQKEFTFSESCAKKYGISRSSLRRLVPILREAGLIEYVPSQTAEDTPGKAIYYRFAEHSEKTAPECENEKKELDSSGKVIPKDVVEVMEILSGIVKKAEANPEKYEFRLAKTEDFIAENPDVFSGKNIKGLSQRIGRAAELLNIPREVVYHKDVGVRRQRRLPMLRINKSEDSASTVEQQIEVDEDVPKELAVWNYKQANILREKRLQSGLSIKELADIVHYPFYAIQSWESGLSAPSSEAMNVLCHKFGRDFREKIFESKS